MSNSKLKEKTKRNRLSHVIMKSLLPIQIKREACSHEAWSILHGMFFIWNTFKGRSQDHLLQLLEKYPCFKRYNYLSFSSGVPYHLNR